MSAEALAKAETIRSPPRKDSGLLRCARNDAVELLHLHAIDGDDEARRRSRRAEMDQRRTGVDRTHSPAGAVRPRAERRDGLGLGRALRTGIADRIQNIVDLGDSVLRREAGRRILPCDVEGPLASVRVGAVLHPPVRRSLVDGTGLLQHRDRPAAQHPDRGPPFLVHQHRNRSLAPSTNPCRSPCVPRCYHRTGIPNPWGSAFPRVPRCAD